MQFLNYTLFICKSYLFNANAYLFLLHWLFFREVSIGQ